MTIRLLNIKFSHRVFIIACSLGLYACNSKEAPGRPVHDPNKIPILAVVSYWQPDDYKRLPANSMAMINLNNGIIGTAAARIELYKEVVKEAKARGIRLLAYVPTGFGLRDPDKQNPNGSSGQSLAQIKAQIHEWVSVFGKESLYGIFFDETHQECKQAEQEFTQLSQYVRELGLKTSFWNPGAVGPEACLVKAIPIGDAVVTFESSLHIYLTDRHIETQLKDAQDLAKQRGIKTWHIIHSAYLSENNQINYNAGLRLAINKLKERQPDYAYITNFRDWDGGKGDNTWGAPPVYWEELVNSLGKE